MPEFLNLLSPHEALDKFQSALQYFPKPELIPSAEAIGRITFENIVAPIALPSFNRSSVDGYAVRAADTYGASDSLPAYLQMIGEVRMGNEPLFKLNPAECSLIHTGGMLPDGADAVVMVEQTQTNRSNEVEILKAVAPGENCIQTGEDIRAGEVVIQSGTRLRPAEIGGLMALGITRVSVAQKPFVGIISTGDEVIAPEMALQPGKVRDVNSYTLKSLIEEAGGIAKLYGILPDAFESIRIAARQALEECDCIIITAGSSASVRDMTAEVIAQLGTPGVLVHGINIKPGKPTILAVCEGKPVIGLPGNPVSALVIAILFIIPVLDGLSGKKRITPHPKENARLRMNIPSQAGREDWIPVRLIKQPEGWEAEPIFGKSNLIFTLCKADGLARIPESCTGLNIGDPVEVLLI